MRMQMIQIDLPRAITTRDLDELNDICGCTRHEAISDATGSVWYAIPDRHARIIWGAVTAAGYAASLISNAQFNEARVAMARALPTGRTHQKQLEFHA